MINEVSAIVPSSSFLEIWFWFRIWLSMIYKILDPRKNVEIISCIPPDPNLLHDGCKKPKPWSLFHARKQTWTSKNRQTVLSDSLPDCKVWRIRSKAWVWQRGFYYSSHGLNKSGQSDPWTWIQKDSRSMSISSMYLRETIQFTQKMTRWASWHWQATIWSWSSLCKASQSSLNFFRRRTWNFA